MPKGPEREALLAADDLQRPRRAHHRPGSKWLQLVEAALIEMGLAAIEDISMEVAMDITTEPCLLIEAALEGDPALALLVIRGESPKTLTASITAGIPANTIGGATYGRQPLFQRETLVEFIQRIDPDVGAIGAG